MYIVRLLQYDANTALRSMLNVTVLYFMHVISPIIGGMMAASLCYMCFPGLTESSVR